MADDQLVVVADQANTSASATTIRADLTAIVFIFVSVSQISWPTISRLFEVTKQMLAARLPRFWQT